MRSALFVRFVAAVAIVASAGVSVGDRLPRNWPLQPSELQRRFEREHFVITHAEDAGTGRTGALKLKIAFADGKVVAVKWKALDEDLDDWNNSPRRELASYEIQRLFLDENDFVVPTSAPRCLPLEIYGAIRPAATPTFKTSRCVLGVLSVWLKDVSAPDPFYDEDRFASDPRYARRLADFNLLTYLIDHRDGAHMNLLLSTDASDPRSFTIDNGISFESFPWNMSVSNWDRIRVPWLRKQSVDRLRAVDKATLARLGVVAEMALDENGIFEVTAPGPNIDDDKGVRRKDGRIQFGLTELEIARLEGRIARLLREVDEGKMPVQ